MIFDDLTNLGCYRIFNADVKAKIEKFIQKLTPDAAGRFELDGKNLFANVSGYATHDAGSVDFEVHREYLDIQFLLLGAEKIYYSSIDNAEKNTKEYVFDNAFYQIDRSSGAIVNLQVGNFVIFFPGEPHEPGVNFSEASQDVVKVVIKVHKSLLK